MTSCRASEVEQKLLGIYLAFMGGPSASKIFCGDGFGWMNGSKSYKRGQCVTIARHFGQFALLERAKGQVLLRTDVVTWLEELCSSSLSKRQFSALLGVDWDCIYQLRVWRETSGESRIFRPNVDRSCFPSAYALQFAFPSNWLVYPMLGKGRKSNKCV